MKSLIPVIIFLMALLPGACATGPRTSQVAATEEWPTGPGTIPPSWYNYDPALKHWFDPWYVNPYTPR